MPSGDPIELAGRLQLLLQKHTVRELADLIKVNYALVWKTAARKPTRIQTRIAIEEGLDRLSEGDVPKGLALLRRQVLIDLGPKAGRRLADELERVVAAAYRRENKPMPRGGHV